MKTTYIRIVILIILALFLCLGNAREPVSAHPLNNGYSQLTVGSDGVDYELFIPEISLLRFDTNKDNRLSESELSSDLAKYIQEHVRLEQTMKAMPVAMKSMRLDEKETVPGVSFVLHYEALEPIKGFTLQYSLLFDDADPLHINFVLITEGDDVDQAVMDTAHRSYHYQSLHPATLGSTLWNYFMLGIEHILSGYDHLLFLLSLLLIARRMSEVVKIVTAFTIAHSITLVLAAMEIIKPPGAWVETGIALTICYVAVENIVVRSSRLRWVLTFAFGLIHGMGFASALGEIGLPKMYFATSLASFNLGVEAGQLSIVVLVLPLLLRLQRFDWYRKVIVVGGSVVIFLLAAYWALERLEALGG
ncbi:HupE/UreJ family protein [Paenibacillus cremeus]|nr:HupE/UreJ family protein [Paenibacillus cremeus]